MQRFTVDLPTPWYLPRRATALVDVEDQRQEIGALYIPRTKETGRRVFKPVAGNNGQDQVRDGLYKVFSLVSLHESVGLFMFPDTWPGATIGRVRHLVFTL